MNTSCETPTQGSAVEATVNGLDQSLSACVRNGVGSEKRGRGVNPMPRQGATLSENIPQARGHSDMVEPSNSYGPCALEL